MPLKQRLKIILSNSYFERIVLILVTIAIILSLIFVIFTNIDSKDDRIANDTNIELATGPEILPINDVSAVRITSDKTLVLPEGWTIYSIENGVDKTLFDCTNIVDATEVNCIVNHIKSEDLDVMISIPGVVYLKNKIPVTESTEDLKVNDVDFKVTYKRYMTFTLNEGSIITSDSGESELLLDDNSEEAPLYYEISACSTEFCVSSGKLPEDVDGNKKAVEVFLGFVKSLRVL